MMSAHAGVTDSRRAAGGSLSPYASWGWGGWVRRLVPKRHNGSMRSHSGSAGPAWRNWAGNVSASPRRVASPGTAAEVAAEVARAAEDGQTIRMTGSGHSFTPAAVADGVLLRPD